MIIGLMTIDPESAGRPARAKASEGPTAQLCPHACAVSQHQAGRMLWLARKTLSGSYRRLSSRRRAYADAG
jgi:hypothetical protein